jgi:Ca2+-transporting ATPase
VAVFALVGSIYLGALALKLPEAEVRALTFAALVITNFGLIFVNRAYSSSITGALTGRNVALWVVLAATAALLGAALAVPVLRDLFHFGPLHLHDLAIVIVAGMATVLLLELAKRALRKRLLA